MAGVGPQVVQVLEFANARAPELQALHELAHHERMHSAVDAKLSSQRNQRRRRANAFKSHQLPRRLRLVEPAKSTEEELIDLPARGDRSKLKVKQQTATQKEKEERTRCRKHQRRMGKMVEERSWLATPQKNDEKDAELYEKAKWLSTHAWHAKRMLMQERYGHVLAQRRQDKSVSAALTALRKTAVVHDMSYYGVLELYGRSELIMEALQLVSDPSGSAFEQEDLLSGREEGESVLYNVEQFPMGAIAPVTFMWRPLKSDFDGSTGKFTLSSSWQSTKRQLWLWIHPAAFMEAASAISEACQNVMAERGADETIEILDRRGHVSRIKLRGKTSNDLLTQILKPAPRRLEESTAETDHVDEFSSSEVYQYGTKGNFELLHSALHANSRASRTKNNVFAVTAVDPRMTKCWPAANPAASTSLLEEPSSSVVHGQGILCPLSGRDLTSSDNAEEPDSDIILHQLQVLLKWTTISTASSPGALSSLGYPHQPPATNANADDVSMSDNSPPRGNVPCSLLWSLSAREKQRRSFKKDHDLNHETFQRRRQQVDGESIGSSTKLDLLVVGKPAPFPNTSGWDFILTPEYAPVILHALVFGGAMVVGLEEDEAFATIISEPSFPRDFPDTTAGQAYWSDIEETERAMWLRKPTAKRIAYDKLGVASPFQPQWDLLFPSTETDDAPMEDEEEGDESLNVCVLRGEEYMAPFAFSSSLAADAAFVPVAVPTLIRVQLAVPRRGTIEPTSMLYQPTEADLIAFRSDVKWTGREMKPEEDDSLPLLGFITSALYDRPKSAFRALGFCACEPLQRLFLGQTGETTVIALTRTSSSRMLRPVTVTVVV
ncbi:hypothetical protein Poli38472_003056 [Pythium oligandrum]|uniref:POP1-domain-containing protein n=1 Tax=Pythium oligandrum TaxID=41045 RepID=A0A8K1C644_PYTOL|nr:hypothetical protein Poli38472_003056 [Pythium oligandrum]|eukprot:TMW57131.1 hypothetical protein Poli38472_003056 [Pythium oligandrum]